MSVTIVVGKRQLLAALSLLVLTALVGVALVVPAVSEATTTYKIRSASCAGVDFAPGSSSTQYGVSNFVERTGGPGQFFCNPSLPNGAIVTKVQFTLFDSSAAANNLICYLRRTDLTSPQFVINVAEVDSPGGNMGLEHLSTAVISDPTINNASFAYFLQCSMATSVGLGIYGADIIYKISLANA